MKAKGITRADLSRLIGANPTFMRDVLSRGVDPSIERAAAIAHALGMSLGELYDGEHPTKLQLVVDGVTQAGGMWIDVPETSARRISLDLIAHDAVVIQVTGPEMSPRYVSGDVLAGPKTLGANLDNLIGRDCIVMTDDGARHVRFLTRGSRRGRYNLRALDPTLDDVVDVKVTWAAPISLILRGAF